MKTVDRETASRINPLIGYVSGEDTLCGVMDVLNDVAMYVGKDRDFDGQDEGLSLILGAAIAALRYEVENPRISAKDNIEPIAA